MPNKPEQLSENIHPAFVGFRQEKKVEIQEYFQKKHEIFQYGILYEKNIGLL